LEKGEKMKKRYIILSILAVFLLIAPTLVAFGNTWETKRLTWTHWREWNYLTQHVEPYWDEDTYDTINSFFDGCWRAQDFYNRINSEITDSGLPPIGTSRNLDDIAYVLDKWWVPNKLNCQQQCLLFLAGVMAKNSDITDHGSYVELEPNDDFNFKIIYSKDNWWEPAKHSQIIILNWKNWPSWKDWEVDPWHEDFEEFDGLNNDDYPGGYWDSKLYS